MGISVYPVVMQKKYIKPHMESQSFSACLGGDRVLEFPPFIRVTLACTGKDRGRRHPTIGAGFVPEVRLPAFLLLLGQKSGTMEAPEESHILERTDPYEAF